MLAVVWLDEARRDLAAITAYIAERSPAAARKLNRLLVEQTDILSEHPTLFHAGRVFGTREMVAHPNYIIVYRVTSTAVEILNVLHARQQYP